MASTLQLGGVGSLKRHRTAIRGLQGVGRGVVFSSEKDSQPLREVGGEEEEQQPSDGVEEPPVSKRARLASRLFESVEQVDIVS